MRQGRHQADIGETEKLFTPDFYLGEVFTFDTFLLCLYSQKQNGKTGIFHEFCREGFYREGTFLCVCT